VLTTVKQFAKIHYLRALSKLQATNSQWSCGVDSWWFCRRHESDLPSGHVHNTSLYRR
jgi:hypothetical protein